MGISKCNTNAILYCACVPYSTIFILQNLKTYTRHSGGRLTADLVNEVLKDSDVPPAVGAGNTQWDHIEYDGTYYFHFVSREAAQTGLIPL